MSMINRCILIVKAKQPMLHRRDFLRSAASAATAVIVLPTPWGTRNSLAAERPRQAKIVDLAVLRLREKGGNGPTRAFLEVTTNSDLNGVSGELFLDTPQRLNELLPQLRKLLVGRDLPDRELNAVWLWRGLYPDRRLESFAEGRDPLTGAAIWGTRRPRRHTDTGTVMMGLSAVDNALWDLRGKLAGQPVYRLLGGTRDSLPNYLSLTPTNNPPEDRRTARAWFDQGFHAQKWFLRHGPPDGEDGFRKNVAVVEGVRTELGSEARLMFDFAVAGRNRCDWDVPYAVRLAQTMEPFKPFWLEEPFSPEEIDSYARLRDATEIPLATGEHTYTRWNIRPFLERKLVRFIQSDPEWCGGISELLQVADLARQYDGVRLVPHGHHLLAAAQVVASQSEALCPMVEYGVWFTRDRQAFQTRILMPDHGRVALPTEPGLGPRMDWDRLERVE
jgi:L-alanine-DL-glutamate epimerase-like enolase superfamily enzyme